MLLYLTALDSVSNNYKGWFIVWWCHLSSQEQIIEYVPCNTDYCPCNHISSCFLLLLLIFFFFFFFPFFIDTDSFLSSSSWSSTLNFLYSTFFHSSFTLSLSNCLCHSLLSFHFIYFMSSVLRRPNCDLLQLFSCKRKRNKKNRKKTETPTQNTISGFDIFVFFLLVSVPFHSHFKTSSFERFSSFPFLRYCQEQFDGWLAYHFASIT